MSSSSGAPQRVVILTFPPNANPNYGGILQAWALAKSIEKLGYDVFVDGSVPGGQRASIIDFRRHGARLLLSTVLRKSTSPRVQRWRQRLSDERLTGFARRRMRLTLLRDRRGAVNHRALCDVDAFVVGSDQIWRPDYVDLEWYLLGFLPRESKARRVSYAASFGRASQSLGPEERSRSSKLVARFDAVSVRERSAVEVCQQLWEVSADWVLDPTLLLPEETYASLANIGHGMKTRGKPVLASYILDQSPEKNAATQSLSEKLDADVVDIKHTTSGLRSNSTRRTVEEWLAGIATADFIVTDSYHGCLFAITFHRPFLVIPNRQRGVDRFDSILGLLSLDSRSVSAQECVPGRMLNAIDWVSVDRTLASERERSLTYLGRALSKRA